MQNKTILQLLAVLVLSSAVAWLALRLLPDTAPSPPTPPAGILSSDDYYRMIRDGFTSHNPASVMEGVGGLAALQPESCKAAMNLCLSREYFRLPPDLPYQPCYAEAAALCGPPPHDSLGAMDYALMLLLADDPTAAAAAEVYVQGVPLPDGEYFQELVTYERPRLVEQLLRPLGAPQ